jgi:hypothetical protein
MKPLLVSIPLLALVSIPTPGCRMAPTIDLTPITDAALIAGICTVISSLLWAWAISRKGGSGK